MNTKSIFENIEQKFEIITFGSKEEIILSQTEVMISDKRDTGRTYDSLETSRTIFKLVKGIDSLETLNESNPKTPV